MHDQTCQYPSSANSHLTPTDTDFWLWEGHPEGFQASVVTAETKQDAPSWALKLGKEQYRPEMQYASTSAADNMDEQQQQQQFMDYWSRQDDRILSLYMPGYQAQQSRPQSPALSSGLASSLRDGNFLHIDTCVCGYFAVCMPYNRFRHLSSLVSAFVIPASNPNSQAYQYADMMQPKGNLTFPEELEDDYLLMESLDLPPASVLPR